MANSLGALTVLLGLDASEYVRGLTKAEVQAKQFSQNVRSTLLEVGKVLGGLELGRQFLDATKEIISQASALQDLSAATGSTVENLSRLTNQAKIAGADLATVQNAVLKLSQGMSGADDEATKTKEALRILGITTKDPVEALQQAAVKLNQYADGVNKVGFAVALFGKQGAQFTATLKDIAELQDVGATVTAKQAEEAQALEQQFRRLSVEAEGFKNLVLSGLVPALRDMISQFTEGIRVAGGFAQALRLFGQIDTGNLASETTRITAAIEHAQEVIARNKALFGNGDLFGGDRAVQNLQTQLRFLQALAAARGLASISSSNNDARDLLAQRKPTAPNPPALGGGAGAKDRVSEAQRFLDSLKRQLETTQDLKVEEKALNEIQSGRLKGLTPDIEAQILAVAREIDAYKELEKWVTDSARAFDEEVRAMKVVQEERKRNEDLALTDAENSKKSTDALRDEIAVILGGEHAREALAKAYADAAIAEEMKTRAQREAKGASVDELKTIDDTIEHLREYRELLDGKSFAEQLVADAKSLQDVKNAISDSLVQPLTDVVTGTKNAKDAFKDFGKSVEQQIARIAAQNLSNALFGGNTSGGPDIFGVLAKLLGGLGGAGAGAAAGGIADIGAGGFGGLGYAAAGTTWSRGGSTMVGENGPEVLNLPPGARVTPKNYRSAGATHNINVSVSPPAGMSRQTAQQFAVQVGSEIGRRMKRA